MTNMLRRSVYLLVLVALTGGILNPAFAHRHVRRQPSPLPGEAIPKFVQPLAVPPVIDARNGRPYTIIASEFKTRVLPRPFPETKVWGYNHNYPGPTILAKRHVPARATNLNHIVHPSILPHIPIDQTIHWADPLNLGCAKMSLPLPDECFEHYRGPVPITVHLHGGETPSAFDGTPDSWFTGSGLKGPEYVTNKYIYPNNQQATTLWYHDHALGITRLNIFAGLSGMYVLTDPPNEPSRLPKGEYEIPLVLQDRSFDTHGQLFFPDDGDNPDVHPFWKPEFFGDVIVVNGRAWPYMEVEPRRYRFRVLDGSTARFYTLKIEREDGGTGPSFWQIGSDGGYLDNPVKMDTLTLAPAERADLIVDFSHLPVGTRLTLTNSANGPFPDGDPVDPNTTGQVMQFRIINRHGRDHSRYMSEGMNLRPHHPIVDLVSTALSPPPGSTVPIRRLVLKEVESDSGDPLIVTLNNSRWIDEVTETPRVGATEIWEIVNITDDSHPIHIHLIQFQIINRQDLDSDAYIGAYFNAFPGGQFNPASGPPLAYGDCYNLGVCGGNPDPTPYLSVSTIPPNPNEAGWKDTIQASPGQVTRLVVRWAPQDTPANGANPGVNLFSFDPAATLGTVDGFGYPGGAGYVWHCHMADHEDNEMMRPLVVKH